MVKLVICMAIEKENCIQDNNSKVLAKMPKEI